MVRTVIFDMDGVIVDTEPLHAAAYFAHFEEIGIAVSKEFYAQFAGKSTRNVYQILVDHFGITTPIEELMQGKRRHFKRLFEAAEGLELILGVRDLIERLHAAGLQMLLASSAAPATIEAVFTRFNLYPYFTHLVSGAQFPRSKPDPAIFNHAVELSGCSKEECVIIEDSTNGIQAANAAGVYVIGFKSPNTHGQNLATADIVFDDFQHIAVSELMRKFEKH